MLAGTKKKFLTGAQKRKQMAARAAKAAQKDAKLQLSFGETDLVIAVRF
jgi:hypothetical protein